MTTLSKSGSQALSKFDPNAVANLMLGYGSFLKPKAGRRSGWRFSIEYKNSGDIAEWKRKLFSELLGTELQMRATRSFAFESRRESSDQIEAIYKQFFNGTRRDYIRIIDGLTDPLLAMTVWLIDRGSNGRNETASLHSSHLLLSLDNAISEPETAALMTWIFSHFNAQAQLRTSKSGLILFFNREASIRVWHKIRGSVNQFPSAAAKFYRMEAYYQRAIASNEFDLQSQIVAPPRNRRHEIGLAPEILAKLYEAANSSYVVAKGLNISATALKRHLKSLGILKTQSAAATVRNLRSDTIGRYTRTTVHRSHLSKLGKRRIGPLNPFKGKTHSSLTRAQQSARMKARTAARNPNFKNAGYKRRLRDLQLPAFKKVRRAVYERDDFTCCYCGARSQRGSPTWLHAHHILPYWVCPEAYLDPENIATTCQPCHQTKAHPARNYSAFDPNLITKPLLERYGLTIEFILLRLSTAIGKSRK